MMKKIAVMLFLSFLVGMVNASTMPISLGKSSHAVQSTSHNHCEESVTPASHDGSQQVVKFNLSHYCCASIAVVQDPLHFVFNNSSNFYFLGETPKAISNIAESIYKPPKHYL
jgi:hypothetical protein